MPVMPDPLQQLFSNLDKWRHLPNYQLERRLDIFFTPYLVDLLTAHVGTPLLPVIVPEMPLKRADSSKSRKVDYVLFAADGSAVYFVELKTDRGSRRDVQDQYLADAVVRGFPQILRDLLQILSDTNSHHKYFHLLTLLERANQLKIAEHVAPALYPVRRRGFCFSDGCVEVVAAGAPIRVVYIQPAKTDGCDCIDFTEVAHFVGRHADPVSRLLATHLARWQPAAGTMPPEGRDV
ncbi:MAG: hypothetical protein QOF78_2781 [Phycisphaerales bacterium]|jgi:hypothetical protein|nr:hypothetical protein [Phycisphaerales bacterium]